MGGSWGDRVDAIIFEFAPVVGRSPDEGVFIGFRYEWGIAAQTLSLPPYLHVYIHLLLSLKF